MNEIFTIAPYKYAGAWVFDAPERDLHKEALVSGMDDMLDVIANGQTGGFSVLFSNNPFPGHTLVLNKVENGVDLEGNPYGTWYYCPQLNMEGWLCPALFKYYDEAPSAIYIQVKGV